MSLNANIDDCLCFTSHAGFQDVYNIAEGGLRVDEFLLNAHSIGLYIVCTCSVFLVLMKIFIHHNNGSIRKT